MIKFSKLKIGIGIWMGIFVSTAVGLMHADDYVVEDIDFYRTNHRLHAPSMKAAETEGYLELHIAPANEEGVSVNIFKILDTTRLKGLLIVNSISPQHIKDIGHVGPNQNLEHSVTTDRCATKIVIEVATRYPTADTYLQGLIRVVGKQAKVEIISATGVSINGAFFENLEELHIKSYDFQFYGECYSIPCSRNIRVNSAGIHADCPVFLSAAVIVLDGIIYIPNYLNINFLFDFRFTENVKFTQLGDLIVRNEWHGHFGRRLKGSGNGCLQESDFADVDIAINKISLNYDVDIKKRAETSKITDNYWIEALIDKQHYISIQYYDNPFGLMINTNTWDEQSHDIINEIANYLNKERF